MKKLPIVIAVIITAMVVGGGMYWYQNTKAPETTIVSEKSDETEKETMPEKIDEPKKETLPKKIVDTPINGPLSDKSFKAAIGGYYNYGKDGDNINFSAETLAKLFEDEEEIGSIFQNPSIDSSVIFATCITPSSTTSTPDGGVLETATSRIYSYDFVKDELIKLYDEDNKQYYCLKGSGMEGSKLILKQNILDDSPRPCTSWWLGFYGDFLYLELADISAGLQPYTIPDDKIEEEKAKQEKCECETYNENC